MSLMGVANSDRMMDLLALIERDHQRIGDLEQTVVALRQELTTEIQKRHVLSGRVDMGEVWR